MKIHITAPKQQPRSYFETTINLKQNNPIFEKLIILKSRAERLGTKRYGQF